MSRWLGAARAAGLVLAGCAGQQGADPRGPLLGKLEQNGVAVGITQPASPGRAVGDCVRIDGTGPSARVRRA